MKLLWFRFQAEERQDFSSPSSEPEQAYLIQLPTFFAVFVLTSLVRNSNCYQNLKNRYNFQATVLLYSVLVALQPVFGCSTSREDVEGDTLTNKVILEPLLDSEQGILDTILFALDSDPNLLVEDRTVQSIICKVLTQPLLATIFLVTRHHMTTIKLPPPPPSSGCLWPCWPCPPSWSPASGS